MKTGLNKGTLMASDTTKYFVRIAARGLGTILLALAASSFAAYGLKHFPGWAIALALLVLVIGCIPAVLFFNLFPGSDEADRPRKSFLVENSDDDWNDLFHHTKRDDYNEPFGD
jgi:hypothetical protein